MSSENNRRIAKNTLALYFRMMFVMGVSLYTSRIILEELGVNDFGIYNVVGGIVVMLGFLNSTMSSVTQRFMSFELGKSDSNEFRKIFSVSVEIHILIAIAVFLLAETIGLWFLNSILVIPSDRIYAANWVYQLSILTFIINVISVPYNATLISHERMNVYAWISIIDVFLKLISIFILSYMSADKLILYSVLICVVSFITRLIYQFYCERKIVDCKFYFAKDKVLFKKMINYVGWDLFGNLSTVVRTQGVNMLLNIYFGPVANAAAGIANQVQGAVMTFGGNIINAIKPQIVKSHASNDHKYMFSLILNSSQYCYLLMWALSIPFIIEMPFILNVWLESTPENTVLICRITLIFNLFAVISTILVTGLHALGRVKRPSLINGTLYILVIPISYLLFLIKKEVYIPFLLNALFVFIGSLLNAYSLRLYLKDFPFKHFVWNILPVCFLISGLSLILPCVIYYKMDSGWLRLILISISSVLSSCICIYYIALDKSYRLKINQIIKRK